MIQKVKTSVDMFFIFLKSQRHHITKHIIH